MNRCSKEERLRIRYAIKLSGHIRGFSLYLFLAILSNLIFKVLPLLTVLATSYLVGLVVSGNFLQIEKQMLWIAILVVLTAIFSYLDVYVSHEMAYRILTHLRDKCYAKLDELAPAALMDEQSGDMISVVLGDVETLEWFYAHTIGQIIVGVLVPISALVFMGTISWVFPPVILPFIVLMIWIPRYSAEKSDVQGRRVKECMGRLNAIIVDGVQGIKDITSFRWQKEYFRKFFAVDRDYAEATMNYAERRADENGLIILITGIATLVTDVTASALVVNHQMDALWLLPVFVVSGAIFAPILEALSMSTNYGLIFAAAERVLHLLEMNPAVEDGGKTRLQSLDGSLCIDFEEVCFSYPVKEGEGQNPAVLEKLSFSFRTGETVALVGASGSGKTTMARLLQRFWDVSDGRILINKTDIREFPLVHLRELLTVIPQEVYLFNQSISENIRLSKLDASDQEISQAAKRAQADEFIRNLPKGYDTVVGERGLRLSGGEKQRLSIAQAFLKDAPILVLDEASANLDAENEHWINQAIRELKKGRATLVIAHRISTIRSADRIVVLKDGRVDSEGSYETLMEENGYFRRLIGEAQQRQKGE